MLSHVYTQASQKCWIQLGLETPLGEALVDYIPVTIQST